MRSELTLCSSSRSIVASAAFQRVQEAAFGGAPLVEQAESVAKAPQGDPGTQPIAGPLLLVVEDDPRMQKMLQIVLGSHGLRTEHVRSGREAVVAAASYHPDLVLLDPELPDSDGVDVIRRLRDWMTAPILVVSGRDLEKEKVAALDAGANDYLTKPFGTEELLARIRVWIRELARVASDRAESTIDIGDLHIDLQRRLVSVAGRSVHLTPLEYKLFATLMRNPERVMSHGELLAAAWGPGHRTDTQYLRVYMGRLREKVESGAARHYFLTEPRVGYRLHAA
jgi:two-component system KDP operon response regulator KdpE